MKKKAAVKDKLRKEVGADAKAILKKINSSLKGKVPLARIEKALATDLYARAKKRMLRDRIIYGHGNA